MNSGDVKSMPSERRKIVIRHAWLVAIIFCSFLAPRPALCQQEMAGHEGHHEDVGTPAIVLDDPAKSGGESERSATREEFSAHVDKAG